MGSSLYLAFRYLVYHRMTTAWLVACIGLTLALPIATRLSLSRFEAELLSRADKTPLLLGAKGSRFELAIHSLHFTGAVPKNIAYREAKRAQETGYVDVVPIHASSRTVGDRKRPDGYAIVGTTVDYFRLRRLKVQAGNEFRRMGQCVIGSQVASEQNLKVGDSILSESQNPYDISANPPLRMKIVGILGNSNSDDDEAVFVDLKTIWIIQGYGHGHLDLTTTDDEGLLMSKDDNEIVASPAVTQYLEITDDNINAFHFHGDSGGFPITAVIALPKDQKSETLFEGRYLSDEESIQVIRPPDVMRELLERIFRAQKFFDLVTIAVIIITVMFVGLVWMLSRRLRQREMETMFKMGCGKSTLFWIQFYEMFLLGLMSIVFASVLGAVALTIIPALLRQLVF